MSGYISTLDKAEDLIALLRKREEILLKIEELMEEVSRLQHGAEDVQTQIRTMMTPEVKQAIELFFASVREVMQ